RDWIDSDFNGANQPVVGVLWYEAMAYAEWRGCRLPTEAEWEYSARGPNSLIYPWGDEFDGDNLVYWGNSNDRTANVGSRPAGSSWVGALDMSGNVWEWTSSLFEPYPYDVDDGRENVSSIMRRVLRGGSFLIVSPGLRATARNWDYPDGVSIYFGFRLLCVSLR
ncbi:MAG: ergothioneine biosynthesis protein EgtB, partial [Anaerolineaceae bacterium]